MDVKNTSLDAVRSVGIRDLAVFCPECGEQFVIPLSAIDLPGDTPLSQIATLRHLACVECPAACAVDLEAMGFQP